MKKYRWLLAMLLSFAFGASCTERLEEERSANGERATVKVGFSDFSATGGGTAETDDVQACLFEGGVMTKVYDRLTQADGSYYLKVGRMSGTLYMLADAGSIVNLKQLQAEGINETEWLETVVPTVEGRSVPFFAGQLNLDEQVKGQTEFPLNLKRGVARCDLLIRGEKIAVRRLTLRNIAQEGYLLPQEEAASPEKVERKDVVIDFETPQQKDVLGVAYVYEQVHPDLEVSADVLIGNKERTLTAELPHSLKRNTVYTVTVRKTLATEEVSLSVEEWEDGGGSALIPDMDDRIVIDPLASSLPQGAEVSDSGDGLLLPCQAADFTLALRCSEELEFVPTPSLPLTVEPLSSDGVAMGRNLFRVRKNLLPPGYPSETAKLQFRRKSLQGVYDEDCLTVTLQENPIRLEGALHFGKDDYTCDFARYVDNELGRLVVPAGMEVVSRFEGEDAWMKVEQVGENSDTYRVLGGWKPNDPTADGRVQAARLVIRRIADGAEVEAYTVKRRNFGMPVTQMNGIWWCKYNAVGDATDFGDQILVPQDPAANAGKTVFEYLSGCTPDEYLKLYNYSAYIGDSGIGMEVINEGGSAKLKGYANPSADMSRVDPKALAPDGYEVPTVEMYDRIFNGGGYMRFDRTNGPYTVQSPCGDNHQVFTLSGERSDISIDGLQLPVLYHAEVYNKVNGAKYESVTFYGPGAQWNGNGVNHNKIVIAAYSASSTGWFHAFGGWGLRRQTNGKENSRILRLVKSPVEYVYGLDSD